MTSSRHCTTSPFCHHSRRSSGFSPSFHSSPLLSMVTVLLNCSPLNSSAKQASAPAGNVSLAASAGNRPQYTPGSAVQDAADALENISQSRPGAYESRYAEQIDAVLDELLNGKRPVYDPSRDPLYGMYRDQYMQSGKAAMQDTMANAAALSGGYGNSYAATAGNEAYQAYLAQLGGIIPELAELAYARYEDELAAKRANLYALSGLE